MSFSERDKGARFERLMKAYLQSEPKYTTILKTVWLWEEFPYRNEFGGKDLGIDIVALTYDDKYWAVQCKCYAEDARIDKAAADTFLSTSSKRFQDENLQGQCFSQRLWISTTNHWTSEAETTLHNQHPPVSRISLFDLENAPVDWPGLEKGIHGAKAVIKSRELLKHQKKAVDFFHEHFKSADRGRLIMACGTGKTFTSLRIAEKETNGAGLVLFLVPSIALLGQTLGEWATFAQHPIKPICICSDAEVSRRKKEKDEGGFTLEDLALPASTDVNNIVQQFHAAQKNPNHGMTVVFSTYQSIERVSEAQKELERLKPGSCVFDLIICDEAHRTTGVALKNEGGDYDESAFTKVHDNEFLTGRKRIYMTATPRLYKDEVKEKAQEAEAYLCSMDDPALYGEEVYRIGFGEAVENDLLSDYKVLVLTVEENKIPPIFQEAIANSQNEIKADDISKLIGCINALSKRTMIDEELIRASDPAPMRTAVAFCQSIRISKHFSNVFNNQKDAYYETLSAEDRSALVTVDADHIDGTMGAGTRQEKLSWLKSIPQDGNECRILTNVRCLSEGVDVPSLDAVMFLSSRNSQVDVVQSVGRVMRKAPNKKYGYIIIPVIIPSSMSPEDALDKSDCFGVVWTVLNALRAHDDRFNAEINKIDLNKRKPCHILVDTIGGGSGSGEGTGEEETSDKDKLDRAKKVQQEFALKFEQLQSIIFARMVKKVGTRRYWELWARDVASVAEKHIERINFLISGDETHKNAFLQFLSGLQKNLNPSVTQSEAVEMLAQHIITKPVFEALFENYSFVKNNPVSISMQKMIDLLHDELPAKEAELMARFYKSIKARCEGVNNAEGKQKIIVELYDKFFKAAFPNVVEKLGIVYTPVEVVDFIIHSVADVLKKEFNRGFSDENVHILDPFTGTGTFITRLLQSGLIDKKLLVRKYEKELHANEIVLLAYYIASINIENAYHDLIGQEQGYRAFDGICLTDTFQLGESEDGDKLFSDMFPQNSKRVIAQKKAPIRIIIGNPPYSVGQKSANDNAQNQDYPILESRIETTYAKTSSSNLIKSLYDSYVKAFRWSSDRLDQNGGIICFVSNAGWLDGNAMDGFRKCLEREFSSIYVFNLRGNCRTSGELRRKEAGNVFGLGSRTPISITLLVKNPKVKTDRATISYHDIGDYLSREEKLKIVKNFKSILNPEMNLRQLVPNAHGDWISLRDDVFSSFVPIEPEKKFDSQSKSFFSTYAIGISTNRDTWVYNYSSQFLISNMSKMIDFYNHQRLSYQLAFADNKSLKVEEFIDTDSAKISWTVNLKNNVSKNIDILLKSDSLRPGVYRPFCRQHLYFDKNLIERPGLSMKLFPTPQHKNLVICVSCVAQSELSVLVTNHIPDLHFNGDTQSFPLYYYEKADREQMNLFDNAEDEYVRKDAVSDFILERARGMYGPKTTKEDVFYYVYGLLHSEEYKKRFSTDLKKSLPRIPLVEEPKDFKAFAKAGRELAELHLNYESQPSWESVIVKNGDCGEYRVQKMAFAKMRDSETGKSLDDKRVIHYNPRISVENIPQEAYGCVVNGKSAIEWVMERYQVTVNKDSQIKNDPNDWASEHNQPRYILDLLLSVITVSMKTVDIVKNLPKLKI